jgi:outer membrane immunogenic protein
MLGTVSSIALMGAAAAADFRVPTKAPVLPPATWAGAYIGLNVGAAWHRWSFNDVDNQLFLPVLSNNVFWSENRAALTIGGQIGYNWQSGNIVYGLESDLNWVDGTQSTTIPLTVLPGAFATASTRLDWLATFRGRVGVTFSPTLLYVTGGLAVAHVRDFYTATFFPGGTEVESNKTRATWVAGVGAEHMLSQDWSVKVEALAIGQTISSTANQRFNNTYRSEFKHSAATFRLGVNRKLPF